LIRGNDLAAPVLRSKQANPPYDASIVESCYQGMPDLVDRNPLPQFLMQCGLACANGRQQISLDHRTIFKSSATPCIPHDPFCHGRA
jgi:hypothetical protein